MEKPSKLSKKRKVHHLQTLKLHSLWSITWTLPLSWKSLTSQSHTPHLIYLTTFHPSKMASRFISRAPRVISNAKSFSTKSSSIPFGKAIPYDDLRSANSLNLPRLPIPSLDDTLSRYMESVVPHCTSSDEYNTHLELVKDFSNTVGPPMQKQLISKDILPEMYNEYPYSYSERWWDDMYLGGRW